MKSYKTAILVSCGALALAGCGPSDIASTGTSGNVTINYPAPTPTPAPTPAPTSAAVTPAAGCPTIEDPAGLTDSGTITGAGGTWRVCTLPSTITRSTQLPKIAGLLYSLNGRVNVGSDLGFTKASGEASVTLSISPGVILFGNTGTSWLAVNRGNKINAVGSATQPIIFTSRDNVLGLNTETSQGQWGGVVLMGRAKITDCAPGSTVVGGTCQRETEGSSSPALFGGQDDTDNSGSMKYVQIRYSGYVLGADKELQALTTEGTGSGTVLDYIQSYNSSDDGAEFFGGVVNMKHYIAVGADDDSLDIDTGLRGNFQYVLLIQRSGAGDALMEVDSNGNSTETVAGTTTAVFRQTTTVANFTAIQPAVSSNNEANDQASILLRGNADLTLVNGVIYTPNNECIRMDSSGIVAPGTNATLTARAVVMSCNSTKYIGSNAFNASAVATAFGSGSNGNNDALTSTLTSLFINGANENAVAGFDATTLSTFFTKTTYIGAVQNSTDTWYTGWTCNSGAANLGSTNTACTTLPTT